MVSQKALSDEEHEKASWAYMAFRECQIGLGVKRRDYQYLTLNEMRQWCDIYEMIKNHVPRLGEKTATSNGT